MLVKMLVEIVADIDVFPDDVLNSDTIGEYKAELDCSVGNDSLYYLMHKLPNDADIVIHSAEPWGDGVDEYGKILDNWRPEYERKMSKYHNNEG